MKDHLAREMYVVCFFATQPEGDKVRSSGSTSVSSPSVTASLLVGTTVY